MGSWETANKHRNVSIHVRSDEGKESRHSARLQGVEPVTSSYSEVAKRDSPAPRSGTEALYLACWNMQDWASKFCPRVTRTQRRKHLHMEGSGRGSTMPGAGGNIPSSSAFVYHSHKQGNKTSRTHGAVLKYLIKKWLQSTWQNEVLVT